MLILTAEGELTIKSVAVDKRDDVGDHIGCDIINQEISRTDRISCDVYNHAYCSDNAEFDELAVVPWKAF